MRFVLLMALLVGCARTTYLGAPLPRSCQRSLGACEIELRLRGFADSDIPARASLTAYVEGVTERIARVSTLERTPKIMILEADTAAVMGDTITFGRQLLVKLGSEAELAAIIAHEIVHMEGKLAEMSMENGIDNEQMQALESIADERAVLLLERAGYPSYAAYDALTVALDWREDDRHPPKEVRLRRVAALVDTRSRLDDGRARFLAAIAGQVLDIDFAYGGPVDKRIVFPRSQVAVALPAGVELTSLWGSLHGSQEPSNRRYAAYGIGPAAGAELVAHLRGRRVVSSTLGTVYVGTAPTRTVNHEWSSLERMLAQARANRWTFEPHTAIAVLLREDEAIVLHVVGTGSMKALVEWIPLLQRPTSTERAEAVSARIVPTPVPRAGKAEELAGTCLDPRSVHVYENPKRKLAAGDLLKCTDRRIH